MQTGPNLWLAVGCSLGKGADILTVSFLRSFSCHTFAGILFFEDATNQITGKGQLADFSLWQIVRTRMNPHSRAIESC
jgi:hypothetical protein